MTNQKADAKAALAMLHMGNMAGYIKAMTVIDRHQENREKRAGDPRLDDPDYTLGLDGKFYPSRRRG